MHTHAPVIAKPVPTVRPCSAGKTADCGRSRTTSRLSSVGRATHFIRSAPQSVSSRRSRSALRWSRLGENFAQQGVVRPLVSFVIPVRNDATRLKRCLASIVGNDYPRELIEIIVVDNDSTDGSAKAAREHGAIVIRSSGDSVAAHRNRGARAALGSIIAFADADHEIDPHWIATAEELLSDPAVAATGSPYLTEPSANW